MPELLAEPARDITHEHGNGEIHSARNFEEARAACPVLGSISLEAAKLLFDVISEPDDELPLEPQEDSEPVAVSVDNDEAELVLDAEPGDEEVITHTDNIDRGSTDRTTLLAKDEAEAQYVDQAIDNDPETKLVQDDLVEQAARSYAALVDEDLINNRQESPMESGLVDRVDTTEPTGDSEVAIDTPGVIHAVGTVDSGLAEPLTNNQQEELSEVDIEQVDTQTIAEEDVLPEITFGFDEEVNDQEIIEPDFFDTEADDVEDTQVTYDLEFDQIIAAQFGQAEYYDDGVTEQLIDLPTPVAEISEASTIIAEVLDEETVEADQLHSVLAKILLITNGSDESIDQDEDDKKLTVLFEELLETAGVEPTPELVESFIILTRRHYLELLTHDTVAQELETTPEQPTELGTREFIQILKQKLTTVGQSLRHLFLIGRAALNLYSQVS